MSSIQKIKLFNFKRFQTFEASLDLPLNVFIGDNEAGKSSILTAIDLTLSGSRSKVENKGLEHLFNLTAIQEFLASDRNYAKLPVMSVELYLANHTEERTSGKNNSDRSECDGIRLRCLPSEEYSEQIREILKDPDCLFPFEFYSISFTTFADQAYSSYTKVLRHIMIDNSQVNSEYAMSEYIREIYNSKIENKVEKNKHQHEYRTHKESYKSTSLKNINSRLSGYEFAIRSSSKANLETDLTILDANISIDNKGKGKQCIIKTELALTKKGADLDVVLLEEPENHLSHANMKRLIHMVQQSTGKQIVIATHSDMISTRLDLRKCILLNSSSASSVTLSQLTESTAKFFVKAPDNNMLEFILAKKVLLVEGDAEFILVESLFRGLTGQLLSERGIHVISVDGTSFARYLELAHLLEIKTAVITDNDGDYQQNCQDRYDKFIKDHLVKVFADQANERSTFEICMYLDNQTVCDALFKAARKKLSVVDFMLKNKAEAAFQLLDQQTYPLKAPQYMVDAFSWINS